MDVMLLGALTVMLIEPCFVGSAAELAVMVTWVSVVTFGAV
jgi:hypothetical protein